MSAFVLARAIRSRSHETLSLDRPLRDGDRFDDIDIDTLPKRLRRQVKFSSSEAPTLDVSAFTTRKRNLRIDDLVESAKSDSCFTEASYILTTPFEIEQDLRPFIVAVPSHDEFVGPAWRLNNEALWPAGGDPLWNPLKHVARDDFAAFAARFFIEQAPAASLDLDSPGELEAALFALLASDIGVGTYPNHDRAVSDVAAVLVDFANTVRVNGETTSANHALHRLGLRTDYGRVAQQFPIVRDALVDRTMLLKGFTEFARTRKFVRLIGPPGAGKSWLLTVAAESLKVEGAIVARHYCYLEPGDEDVQRRITTQTLFGNLMADIVDAAPELRNAARPLLGSGPRQLEQVLRAAAERDPNRRVILIIDGLDHIARVLGSATSIAADDTTIIPELASLDLPLNAHLVVASQPGDHLRPLVGISEEVVLPTWSDGEVILLAERLGVPAALQRDAALDDRRVDEALSLIVALAEGNPLYATFVCRTVLQRLRDDGALPSEVLIDLPPLRGDIATYYDWLIPPTADIARLVAETLAFVEFGLSGDDLATILPFAPPYIAEALKRLRPVLRRVTMQGGIRLYHESFRRYVVETAHGGADAGRRILAPVIAWLESAGFYADNRSYRFLLPLLARSGRVDDVLAHLSPTFIEESVAAAHSPAAMSANLLLGVNLALDRGDWPTFIRLVELDRSRSTFAYRMSASLARTYARTFVARMGARALADRLLFDGRPTMDRDVGLLSCALIDEQGETPPWREYLALDMDENEREELVVSEASFRGWARRDPTEAVAALLRWLEKDAGLDDRVDHALALIAHAADVATETELLSAGSQLTGRAGAVLRLGVARVLNDRGDATTARSLLVSVSPADVPKVLLEQFGALTGRDAEALDAAADILDIHAVLPDRDRFQTRETDEWIATVNLLSRVHPADLATAREALQDSGWAAAWMRYVIDIASAQACESASERDAGVIKALEELRAHPQHPNPFSIYGAEKAIHESFARALRAVSSARFSDVINLIEAISRATHSHFQGSAMGPLVTEAFLGMSAAYVAVDSCRDAALDAMTRRVSEAVKYGEFFETHAEHHLLLAMTFASVARVAEANEHWQRAAVYLAAYGFRRDITLFEPLAALKTLAPLDLNAARERAALLQPLAESVDDHTDGKDTKWVYHRWFDALLTVDLHGAIEVLTDAVKADAGATDWRVEDAYDEVAERLATVDVHPVLATYIQAGTRGKGAADAVTSRTAVLRRLLASYPEERHLITVYAAAISDEAGTIEPATASSVATLAAECQVEIQALRASPPTERPHGEDAKSAAYAHPEILPTDLRDLVIAFHRSAFGFTDNPRRATEYADTLGFRLLPHDDATIVRIMRTFARAAHYSGGDKVLEVLGDGLAWRGRTHVAAAAYALAFAYARPEWTIFGRREACYLFTKSLQLDETFAHEILQAEAKHLFADYGGNYGFTQHVIELFASMGDPVTSFAVFDASVQVIGRRLPLHAETYHPFSRYAANHRTTASIDAAAAALLVVRTEHPEIYRRRAALAGVTAAIEYGVAEIPTAMAKALRPEAATLDRIALLDILVLLGEDAARCIEQLLEPLRHCATEPLLGIQALARRLLASVGEASPASTTAAGSGLTSLTADEVARFVDVDARARTIAHYVPKFGPLFAGVLDAASKDETRKARIRAESKRYYDRANERFPDHFIYGHQAIVENALHSTANMTISPDTEDEVAALEVLRPHTEHYVAHWHSRAARPRSLALPHDRVSGVTSPVAIDDDVYNGWYRIGYYEREILRSDYARRIAGEVLVMSGVQLHPGDSANPEFCFVNGTRRQRGFPQCLAGMHETNGPLGRIHIILPALELIDKFKLNAASWTAPVVAADIVGPAVVYRQWRAEPLGTSMEEETPTLTGCELLLRPDLFRSAYNLAAGWVSEVALTASVKRPKNRDVEE